MTNRVLRLVHDSSPSSKGKLLRSPKIGFGKGMLFVVIVNNNSLVRVLMSELIVAEGSQVVVSSDISYEIAVLGLANS